VVGAKEVLDDAALNVLAAAAMAALHLIRLVLLLRGRD
jgi:Zn-dependent membrane protease YugP